MLDIRHLSKTFGAGSSAVTALHHIDQTVQEGEFFTLLGPSGCGKTTLLRLIAGFEPPTAGALILDGQDVTATPPNRRPVNTVFQNYALFPHMTVAQNIGFGLDAQGRPKAEVEVAVDEMLALVQMADLRNRKSGTLSGGQQQRVALARALAPKPRILLLDEPLSALDMKLRKEMQIELKRLQQKTGLTFIFVTHDQEEALTMSDRIAVMNGGRIRQTATPRELYESPANRFVAGFIGESNFLQAQIVGDKVSVAGAKPVALDLPSGSVGKEVTVLIRPEHVVLSHGAEDAVHLKATVEQLVYFGTDTHVHLVLEHGAKLVARVQNALRGGPALVSGNTIAIALPREALRVLDDEGDL
jgi:spermidine/putrescine transport system ATP-binding protein